VALALDADQLETIHRDFPARDQADIVRLLTEECGTNLPLLASGREKEIQRIRRAVLKLSAGSVDQFLYWLDVAKRDWRDVLIGN
jgi:hypothetical protein